MYSLEGDKEDYERKGYVSYIVAWARPLYILPLMSNYLFFMFSVLTNNFTYDACCPTGTL